MNYEKQTYLNTERLNELYRTETVLAASVPSLTLIGGIRFFSESAHKVKLEAYFPSCGVSYTPYFDGRAVVGKSAPYFSMEVFAERGEHVFDFEAASQHGGAILRVTGVGVRECKRYVQRVGGYYTSARTVLYIKRGLRPVEKIVFDGSEAAVTEMTDILYDACLYYDKTESAYTSSIFYFRHVREDELKVNTVGQVTTLTVAGLNSAAIVDGQALPSGYDCIVACTDQNGVLHFYAGPKGGLVAESSTTVSGVKRVVSAQRGTTFLVQDRENVWRAYVFGAGGDKSISVNGISLPYTLISLSRNAVFAPSADLILSSMEQYFYYKDGKGALVRKDEAGETSVVGLADEYYPGPYGMLLQDNEIAYGE